MPEFYVQAAYKVEAESAEEALKKVYDATDQIHEYYWRYKDLNDDDSKLGITHVLRNEVSQYVPSEDIPEGFQQTDSL